MSSKRLFVLLLTLASISTVLASLATYLRSRTSIRNVEDSEPVLLVDGLVDRSLNLTYEEILAMPQTTVDAELRCVDGPTLAINKGNWSGVRLGFILGVAEVLPSAIKVAFHAKYGYETDLSITTAVRENVIVAYSLNGQPLTERLRLVAPGKWGYKWISQLTRIELVDYDSKGFF